MSSDKSKDEMEYWRDDVEKIKNNTINGSIYMSNAALDVVEEFVKRRLYRNRTELIQSLSKLRNALVRAKPLMALIYNRTESVLEFIQRIPKDQKDVEIIQSETLEYIKSIREESERSITQLTRWGGKLIMDHHTILTHSASSIVENILMEARRHKKRFKVICTESRPQNEGALLAERLAKAGIKTTLITDANIARAVSECHYILTGADRFTETHFVNKIGTHAIAALAKTMDKPFYIAGESTKVLLRRMYPVRFLPNEPNEVFETTLENLQVENDYFEETSLDFIQKIILEDGVIEMKEFRDRYL